MIPVFEWAKRFHALDRAATVISDNHFQVTKYNLNKRGQVGASGHYASTYVFGHRFARFVYVRLEHVGA
jgi:hypothetical protein